MKKIGKIKKGYIKYNISNIIYDHNYYFLNNEIGGKEINEHLSQILEGEKNKKILLSKNTNITKITQRQQAILKQNFKLKIEPSLNKIKEENVELYNELINYYNDKNIDLDEFNRKLTNKKRFKEVIGKDDNYLYDIIFDKYELDKEVTTDLINKFTRINNLFIKKDSTNALSMLDNTREPNGELISDSRLTEMTVFDRLDKGVETRKGYNIIQGASENMITQAIQKRILEFNEEIISYNFPK